MTLYNINYALTVFLIPNLLIVNAQGVDYSQCAIDANQSYWKAPNDTFLYDQYGKQTGNMSQAWGISYESCKKICGSPVNTGGYNWNALSQGLTSWLLPWLALTAQLPFETKDKQTNFIALLLALGSPSLITFSLALTILEARWINRIFRHIKENNKGLRPRPPLQAKAIKAARVFLIESQHIPIQIFNGPRREFAQLVVCPENWAWWHSIQKEIQKTKREWTYSLYAQVGWVCVSQLLAIVDFFTSASFNTGVGLGLAINSLWIWMIPVVLGWVYVGTQTSAGSIEAAIASTTVPVLGTERDVTGECIGIHDRTTFDESCTRLRNSFCHSCGEKRFPGRRESPSRDLFPGPAVTSESSQTIDQSEDILMDDISRNSHLAASMLLNPEQESRPLVEPEHQCSLSPYTFFGFSIAGCELEPGPVFNYARIWSHMNAVQHVAEAFSAVTLRQKAKETVHGQPWNDELGRWNENLRGSPEELSKYISVYDHGEDNPNFSIHGKSSSKLVLNCIAAAWVTIFLQWSSTGAAMVIAYKTPVVGLGCQSGSYLIYGIVSTLAWLALVLSASLSNQWSLQMETPKLKPRFVLGALAVATRLVGKLLAAANAVFLVTTSALQFTGFYDNCWCDACIPSLGRRAGWVILFASDAQIAVASQGAWIGGVSMSFLCVAFITFYFLTSRGDEVFKRNMQ